MAESIIRKEIKVVTLDNGLQTWKCEGTRIINHDFIKCEEFSNGVGIFQNADGSYGWVDINGNIQYNGLYNLELHKTFNHNEAVFKDITNNHLLIVDTQGDSRYI